MPFSLTWLPDVLKQAGLKVAEVPGWQFRGRREIGHIVGVICHHTAGPRTGNMPSLGIVRDGRSDLPGPLAQLGLGRDGTFYVIAAGRCNHAGNGLWQGVGTGNGSFIGIEAEHTGRSGDPWPDVQMEAYRRGVAAILRHVGRSADFCCGHREFARPVGRKTDPTFDMGTFRASVAAILDGSAGPPAVIPAVEPRLGRPTLRRGAEGPLVGKVQDALDVEGPDIFGPKTEAAVRRFQHEHGMVPDGIVGPDTWAALDAAVGEIEPSPPGEGDTSPERRPEPAGDGVLAWGAHPEVSAEFKQKVVAISRDLGCDPNHLMACMAFETGESFKPSERNRHSGATGLIQFMPSTARALGTTTGALAEMTAVEQLDYVARYFRPYRSLGSLEDLYMAILWPRGVGKPDGYMLFAKPSIQYRQNRGLDRDGDGQITKWEAAAAVRAKLEKGLEPGMVG